MGAKPNVLTTSLHNYRHNQLHSHKVVHSTPVVICSNPYLYMLEVGDLRSNPQFNPKVLPPQNLHSIVLYNLLSFPILSQDLNLHNTCAVCAEISCIMFIAERSKA